MSQKKTVYIASPYTKGDTAINVRFQCEIFDNLLDDGRVLPIAPLWSHFQHLMFPRPYADWIKYDQELLHLFDCCLRLDARDHRTGYLMAESSGADGEVDFFRKLGKPVFFNLGELNLWLDDEVGNRE